MSAMGDVYFTVRQRRKVCRFCGNVFYTTSPARKTCERAACKRKSAALVKEQNKAANERYQKRKRRAYVRGLGR